MLRELRVRNLALLEEQEMHFEPGLNVLTGATGAGKSLVLQALTLLLGGRFSQDALRTGAVSASVEALFEISDAELARRVTELHGGEPADADADAGVPFELLVKRRAGAGRNRCEVNGSLVTVKTLRELGRLLVEIHGQSEHQELLDTGRQTELLDRFAGLSEDTAAFAGALGAWRSAEREVERLRRDRDEVARRVEELEALVEEVARVAPEPGESDGLRKERRLLVDAERYAGGIAEALALVAGADGNDDACAGDRIGRAARTVADAAELLPEIAEAAEALDEAGARLDEAVRSLEAAAERVRTDPERLAHVDDRLAELGTLLRRHGPGEDDALEAAADADAEATRLRAGLDDASGLAAAAAARREEVLELGLALNARRRKAAAGFCDAVAARLAELEMPETRFLVVVDDGDPAAALGDRASASGLGSLEFVASTNPGEAPRALARIASGGELARVALAVKSELAGADRVPLLVFDEVDADVGPRMGAVIGRRLAALAADRQVLVVTHLPQVAAFGDHHLKVHKRTADERTTSHVDALHGELRELEIAEMIRGAGRAGEALDQARAMLAEAAEDRA